MISSTNVAYLAQYLAQGESFINGAWDAIPESSNLVISSHLFSPPIQYVETSILPLKIDNYSSYRMF